MKKRVFLSLLTMFLLVTGCTHNNNICPSYEGVLKEEFSFSSPDEVYKSIQGACLIGEEFYIALYNKNSLETANTRIFVFDETGQLLRESAPLKLGTANNITYCSNNEALLVSHAQPDKDGNYCFSYVDPATLKLYETKSLEYPFFAISYCPQLEQYVSARWSGEVIDIWDKNMEHLRSAEVKCPDTLPQGMFSDENYIYFVRSAFYTYNAEILVYDWNCQLVEKIQLPFLSSDIELSNINIANDTMYVIANTAEGGTVFTVEK